MELTTKVFTLGSRTTFCLWVTDSNRPQVVLIGSHTSSTVLVSTGELQGCAQPTHVHTAHQWVQHKTMGKTLQPSLQMTPPLKSPNKQPPQCLQQDNSRGQSGNKDSRVSSVFSHIVPQTQHQTIQQQHYQEKILPFKEETLNRTRLIWGHPPVDGPSGQRRRTRREGEKEERNRHILTQANTRAMEARKKSSEVCSGDNNKLKLKRLSISDEWLVGFWFK